MNLSEVFSECSCPRKKPIRWRVGMLVVDCQKCKKLRPARGSRRKYILPVAVYVGSTRILRKSVGGGNGNGNNV